LEIDKLGQELQNTALHPYEAIVDKYPEGDHSASIPRTVNSERWYVSVGLGRRTKLGPGTGNSREGDDLVERRDRGYTDRGVEEVFVQCYRTGGFLAGQSSGRPL